MPRRPVNLDGLIVAAKKEKPITVYDSTGKIVEMAKNFAKKYGLDAEGSNAMPSSDISQKAILPILSESFWAPIKGLVVIDACNNRK